MKEVIRCPDYHVGDFTELRIHGAGAAPVKYFLESDSYVQVAGDDTAGFYRALEAGLVPESDRDDPRWKHQREANGEPRPIEAYSWGRFSHGGGWRALWVLLLPYTFVNVAGWMVPRNGWRRRILVRLLALLVSVAMVYWFVSMIAAILTQCGPESLCANQSRWLFFADWSIFQASARLAVLALMAGTGITGLLWWAGMRSADRYERYREDDESVSNHKSNVQEPPESNQAGQEDPKATDADALPNLEIDLNLQEASESDQAGQEDPKATDVDAPPNLEIDAPRLWTGIRYTRALAGCHVLAMLAALSAGVAVAVGRLADVRVALGPYSPILAWPRELPAVLLLVASIGLVTFSAIAVAYIEPLDRRPATESAIARFLSSGWIWAIGLAMIGFDAAWILGHGRGPEGIERFQLGDPMLGFTFFFSNIGYGVLVLLLILSLSLLLMSGLLAPRRGANLGFGFFGRLATRTRPFFSALTGIVVLAAMLTGGLLWTAQLLGRLATEEEPIWVSQGIDRAYEELLAVAASLEGLEGDNADGLARELANAWREQTKERMAELGLGPIADRIARLLEPLDEARSLLIGAAEIDPSAPLEELEPEEAGFIVSLDSWSRSTGQALAELSIGEQTIRLSYVYFLMPLAFLVLALLLAGGAALLWMVALVRIPGGKRVGYPGLVENKDIDPNLVNAITGARKEGRISDAEINGWDGRVGSLLRKPYRNGRLALLLIAPGLLFVFLVVWFFNWEAISRLADSLDRFLDVAIWLTVGIFLGLAFAIRSYYSGGGARGALGGIWDIVTYWPRFFHPFSPPSYAVRAVPELTARMKWLVNRDEEEPIGTVLASAHSQGVPTTLAAVGLVADTETSARIALLTFGCPTGLLYSLAFPDYYGPTQMDGVARDLLGPTEDDGVVRWFNLWRLTDWTGGYVHGVKGHPYFEYREKFRAGSNPNAAVPQKLSNRSFTELRLSDPDSKLIMKGDIVEVRGSDPIPGPFGHAERDYLHNPAYNEARALLAASLPSTTRTRSSPEDVVTESSSGQDDGVVDG